jgi:hypothetical protein
VSRSSAPIRDRVGRPVRTYLAARYDRREEMIGSVVPALGTVGLAVHAKWLTGAHERSVADAAAAAGGFDRVPDDFLGSCAAEDLASVFVTVTEGPEVGRTSGGRHVELGYALAFGMRCVVVGPVENVFHHLEDVERYADIDAFLAHERGEVAA